MHVCFTRADGGSTAQNPSVGATLAHSPQLPLDLQRANSYISYGPYFFKKKSKNKKIIFLLLGSRGTIWVVRLQKEKKNPTIYIN